MCVIYNIYLVDPGVISPDLIVMLCFGIYKILRVYCGAKQKEERVGEIRGRQPAPGDFLYQVKPTLL